jgi:hypothetical protein
VRALANEEVANYLNQHFVASFQKVGNFQIVNGQKNGGNVASYFTLADGSVLHALAGPVEAGTFLREARWVVETRKLAIMTSHGDDAKLKACWSKAHAGRLRAEHGVMLTYKRKMRSGSSNYLDFDGIHQHGNGQARVHYLLAKNPLVRIDQIYREVFEKILGEKVSTLPVEGETASQPRGSSSGTSIVFRTAQTKEPIVADADAADSIDPSTPPSTDGDERTAARRLRLAKTFMEDANNVKGPVLDPRDPHDPDRLRLAAWSQFRKIAVDFPNTKAGKEARRLLVEH